MSEKIGPWDKKWVNLSVKKKENYIRDFVNKESELYNTLFKDPFTGTPEPIPYMVLMRVQVRLNLFVQNMGDELFQSMRTDLENLYQMVIKLVHKQPRSNKVVERFIVYSQDLEKNIFKTYKSTKEKIRMDAMFIYSVLDFIGWCIFENVDEEPVIDLNNFMRITERFFNLIEV